MPTRTCDYCKTSFRVRGTKRRFCSRSCASRGKIPPFAERFWSKVDCRAGFHGCWPWMGADNGVGYGLVGSRTNGAQKNRLATHIVYEHFRGPLPVGHHVLHRCDNPRCVNPLHLFSGTDADNHADMSAKGRSIRGERSALAKLTEEVVAEIRTSTAPGTELAQRFGVTRSTISMVRTNQTWKHVDLDRFPV